MQRLKFIIVTLAIFILLIINAQPLSALSINDIQLIKISPSDETAVVRISENDMRVIKVGDSLVGIGCVVQITTGRIVIEAMSEKGREILIIRLENEKQRVERIRKAGEESPVLYTPQSMEKVN